MIMILSNFYVGAQIWVTDLEGETENEWLYLILLYNCMAFHIYLTQFLITLNKHYEFQRKSLFGHRLVISVTRKDPDQREVMHLVSGALFVWEETLLKKPDLSLIIR